jgi:alanyl-tRNA synthetase
MKSAELRSKFLKFFEDREHVVIPSASLIPENDPTVLFTTAGMHPLVPYLMGEAHPAGKRLTDVQKCIRTQDIDDVGDSRHTTFFEMLGIWSLGDYFKESIIPWTFEFFTQVLGFDPQKLYVTVFAGDESAPRDDEAIEVWKAQFKAAGIQADVAPAEDPDSDGGYRIYQYPKAKNWWGPAGVTGPCGPDTEIFYDTGKAHDESFGPHCHPNCDCGRFVEIGNDVFMQFNKQADGTFVPLKQKNVDVGWGLERLVAATEGQRSVFETDLFAPAMVKIEELCSKKYGSVTETTRSMEIIADHIRAAVFIMGDPRGVSPSNVDQGYIVRRFIRRAIRHGCVLGIKESFIVPIAETFIEQMKDAYPELETHRNRVAEELKREEEKFGKTIEKGLKEFEKTFGRSGKVSGEDAFLLYSTYGFPLELTEELARDKGQEVDKAVFESEFRKHQDLSRVGADQKFAGGLADHSVETTRLHTATHMLHQALRTVLGDHVLQRGSNITRERLRFDFSHPEKMTKEQIQQVEEIVNGNIRKNLPVHYEILDLAEAKRRGAIGIFEDKYAQLGGQIKVYFIGDQATGEYFSREVCGGPHVEHTGELGTFKILKEEAVAAGIRRIKAVVNAAKIA